MLRILKMKTILLLLCSLLAACATSVSLSAAIPAKRLAGKWYRGDGTGYNVTLTLNRDSSYDAVWTGCLGTYGTARGTWHLDATKLTFTPTEEKDMMRNHLRTLDVLPDKRGFVLVPPKDGMYFKKWGSESSYWCFKPSK
jgi:hypothetical protein